MQTPKKLMTHKLCRLSSFLHNAVNEFEKVATSIKEKKIKMSVRNIALKLKQYNQEMNSQLLMLKIKCTQNAKETEHNYSVYKNITDKKIVELCCNSETFFSKAYNSILNDYFPFKPLRDMLKYQYAGIRAAFRQLKLLNSLMTSNVVDEAVI